MNDSGYNTEGFLFPGPVWFLAPRRTYGSYAELAEVVLAGHAGPPHKRIVYAFSDEDLAQRFLRGSGDPARAYIPVMLKHDGQLVRFLQELQAHGHDTLGVDATPHRSVRFILIADLIWHIRQRQANPGSL